MKIERLALSEPNEKIESDGMVKVVEMPAKVAEALWRQAKLRIGGGESGDPDHTPLDVDQCAT